MVASRRLGGKTGRRRGLRMTARSVTALIGSYLAAAGSASLLARIMPIARPEATAWGMILSFLIFALLGLWAFYERRLAHVAMAIWGSAVLTTGAVLLLGVRA